MNTDISKRKEIESQRELLLGELNHRVKNIFAVIRSLAALSDGKRSRDEYRRVFLGRLDALSNAHALALEGDWERVDMERLAELTLQPYLDEREDAVEISGAPLELEAKPALSLRLVLHELATNAVKYGALSVPEGRVRLNWAVSDDGASARFTWQESGGPAVSAPSLTGFGTKLVEQVFEYELEGACALEYRGDGLRLDASFSLE